MTPIQSLVPSSACQVFMGAGRGSVAGSTLLPPLHPAPFVSIGCHPYSAAGYPPLSAVALPIGAASASALLPYFLQLMPPCPALFAHEHPAHISLPLLSQHCKPAFRVPATCMHSGTCMCTVFGIEQGGAVGCAATEHAWPPSLTLKQRGWEAGARARGLHQGKSPTPFHACLELC